MPAKASLSPTGGIAVVNVPRLLARAVVYPERPARKIRPLRHLLLQPRVFDLLSLGLQLRDLRRQKKIAETYAVDDPHYRHTQDYNASVTLGKEITRTRRVEELFQMLVLPPRDIERERLLLIGPRDIHEFLLAWLYGFSWRRIDGIDLYSSNPKIQVMNMEDMTFPDGTYDSVLMANTLAYAKDTERCIAECVRILRPGGRLVFGATHAPGSEFPGNSVTGEQIRQMLRRQPVTVAVYRPVDKINALGTPQTVHFFAVTKNDPNATAYDPVEW